MGQFCSWSCMRAFNMNKNGTDRGSKINEYIAVLHKKTTGRFKLIKAAPDRYVLKSFGGTISIDEFRNANENDFPILTYPNQLHKVQFVEKQRKVTFDELSKEQLDNKIDDINNTNASNETLKLKRTKPLKRDRNNLETMMGLVRAKK